MKGNMFLGYAAGSVGDVTFSRSKGQQVARARNRKPNNPKTRKQMTQRSLFMDPVKFYTRGRSALFEFAFESKAATESDYNAFMRLNAKNGIMLKKSDFDNAKFPAIGEYIMTQGSLPNPNQEYKSASQSYIFDTGVVDTKTSAENLKVSELAKLLINSGEYMAGDILTFVTIIADATYNSADPANPITLGGESVVWYIDQLALDLSDTSLVSSHLTALSVYKKSVSANYTFESDSFEAADIAAFCTIHSRPTDAGLKVSTTQLVNSAGAVNAITACRNSAYKEAVLADWNANPDAILGGLIAYRGNR